MAGFTGSCLCGAIRFKSTVDPQVVGHCHCVDCRKSSGTGHCTHLVVPEAAFSVTGPVTFYERGEHRQPRLLRHLRLADLFQELGHAWRRVSARFRSRRSRDRESADDCLRQPRAVLGPHGSGATDLCDHAGRWSAASGSRQPIRLSRGSREERSMMACKYGARSDGRRDVNAVLALARQR